MDGMSSGEGKSIRSPAGGPSGSAGARIPAFHHAMAHGRGAIGTAGRAVTAAAATGIALAGIAAAGLAGGTFWTGVSLAGVTVEVVAPRVIHLPVIPQGNYLDPGPAGPPIRPDVSIGRGENSDYVFPPDLSGGYGSGPPGDPTNDGAWSPLDGDTPSF